MGPRRAGRGKNDDPEEEEENEYVNKRNRNNIAVRKSRAKAKAKAEETSSRVQKLKDENEKLEAKIQLLSKELKFLKDMFVAQVGSAKWAEATNGSDLLGPQTGVSPSAASKEDDDSKGAWGKTKRKRT